ncbi:unnamed protein product [Prorocentrum cordatum]|uniref:Secreted protein n=1 Tax=Prorocentrum cordatum TaxID=2364126 RepID=A0ABN9X175_9DINO|nr:unnamed protein product [Polarella glacialis]
MGGATSLGASWWPTSHGLASPPRVEERALQGKARSWAHSCYCFFSSGVRFTTSCINTLSQRSARISWLGAAPPPLAASPARPLACSARQGGGSAAHPRNSRADPRSPVCGVDGFLFLASSVSDVKFCA